MHLPDDLSRELWRKSLGELRLFFLLCTVFTKYIVQARLYGWVLPHDIYRYIYVRTDVKY